MLDKLKALRDALEALQVLWHDYRWMRRTQEEVHSSYAGYTCQFCGRGRKRGPLFVISLRGGLNSPLWVTYHRKCVDRIAQSTVLRPHKLRDAAVEVLIAETIQLEHVTGVN